MHTRLVITPHDGKNIELLARCVASVKESGIEHLVVRCGSDWELQMYELRNSADYVAWVDADDIVYPGALQAAFNLAEETQAGLVYTNEAQIDKDDKILRVNSGKKTLFDLASHPRSIHHLSVTKKNSITDRILPVFEQTKCPLDWAMRVDAAVNCGLAHLDMIGYGWRSHGNQITDSREFQSHMIKELPAMRRIFREWVTGYKQP